MDASFAALTAMRTGAMQALATQIDAAGTGATLEFYATTKPAPGAAPGGAPLVAVILAFPAGTASAGILTLSDTAFAQITAGGSAVWARLFDAADTWIADFTVGTQAMHDTDPATAEVILAATTLYTGAFLALIGAQIVGN